MSSSNEVKLCAIRRGVLTSLFALTTSPLPCLGNTGEQEHSPPNQVLGAGGLHHTGVTTWDFEQSLLFYQAALGLRVWMRWVIEGRHAAYLDVGDGSYIELIEDKELLPTAGTPEHVRLNHICFKTTRLDDAYKHAIKHGAKTRIPPRDFSMLTSSGPVTLRMCMMEGPSGEFIELIQDIRVTASG